MFLQSQKWGQSLGVLKGCVSYCFNGLWFWMQLWLSFMYMVIILRAEWKPLVLTSGLIVQLHLSSYGETCSICKRIVHTTGRSLKLPLDLCVRSPGNALNNMRGFGLFKRDLALSNIWLFFLYVMGCLWGRICCSSLYSLFVVLCLLVWPVCLPISTPEILFLSYCSLLSDLANPYYSA